MNIFKALKQAQQIEKALTDKDLLDKIEKELS